MAGLVREEERATARELTLRRRALRSSRPSGARASPKQCRRGRARSSAPDAKVRLVLSGRRRRSARRLQRRRSAASRSAAKPPDGSGRMIGRMSVVRRGTLADLRRCRARPRRRRRRWSSALSVRDEVTARSCSRRRPTLPHDMLDSLDSLASQVSLALEAASLAEDLHRQKSEARFRSLVAHSSDLITVLDADGVVTYQSPSIERVLGYSPAEIEGTRFDRLLDDADRSRLERIMSEPGDGRQRHARSRMLASARRRPLAAVRDSPHAPPARRDRSRNRPQQPRHQRAQGVRRPARTSGVPRSGDQSRQPRPLRRPRRSTRSARPSAAGALVGVMFIDLDDFKTVNDSMGHPAGDAVLQHVAAQLEAAVPARRTRSRVSAATSSRSCSTGSSAPTRRP